MTPRNDHPQDAASPPITLETMPTEEPEQVLEEWAQSEGYTPLSELHFSGSTGGGAFMAIPPDSDGHPYAFHAPSEGAFFADMSAFDPEEDALSEEGTAEQNEEPIDFRLLADQALKALEEDYTQTVRRIEEKGHDKLERTGHESNDDQSGYELVEDQPIDTYVESKASLPTGAILPNVEASLPPAEIDTVAVERAVASIRLKDAKLSERYQVWQQTLPPESHELIPPAPLSAFRTTTAKARKATSNLSRSATIAHALHRLHILQPNPMHLLLHILGVDQVESKSVDQIRATFGPLVRWLGASSKSPESIEILLIGPNVVQQPPVDLMPNVKTPLQNATATCCVGVYHELKLEQTPHLSVAFNAGIWGYQEWVPTLKKLKGTVIVVTAYTVEEAEDDADVLLQQPGSKSIWEAECNPFSSNLKRETKSIQDRVYRENAAWQAWCM